MSTFIHLSLGISIREEGRNSKENRRGFLPLEGFLGLDHKRVFAVPGDRQSLHSRKWEYSIAELGAVIANNKTMAYDWNSSDFRTYLFSTTHSTALGVKYIVMRRKMWLPAMWTTYSLISFCLSLSLNRCFSLSLSLTAYSSKKVNTSSFH